MASKQPPGNDPWAEEDPKGKAAKKAARAEKKAARKAKTPWYKQIWQVYKMTQKAEPLIWLWMLIIFVGVLAVCIGIGFLWDRGGTGRIVYMSIIGVPLALMGCMILLARRAERAAYAQIEGKPGAAFSALSQIKRGWSIEQEPIAADPKTQDMVFRAVGRPGIVLIGDGHAARLNRMVQKERQRLNRSIPGVAVTVLTVGNGEGQVPLRKLVRKMQRLKPVLSRQEVASVSNRVKTLGGLRLPIPKGMDPMKARPNRQALRGR